MAWAARTTKPTQHNWGKRPQYGGSGWAWQRLRAQILERDHHTCHWCGGTATTADHVYPRAWGGEDAAHNLVACCAHCNERRRKEQARLGALRAKGTARGATRW